MVHASFSHFYKNILYLCDTAVGGGGGFAVLSRHDVDNLICYLYNISSVRGWYLTRCKAPVLSARDRSLVTF